MRIKTIASDQTGITYNAENQPFSNDYYYGNSCIDLDNAQDAQKILGFGVSMTDASCYMLNTLNADERKALFADLFTPAGLGLSIIRLNVGSSDYATAAPVVIQSLGKMTPALGF